jgi:predicted Zn-dependent protease with MMP-like domain
MLRRRRFEALVRSAIDDLPPALRQFMRNVEIVVEDWPRRSDLAAAGLKDDETLYGLYIGVPLTERHSGYHLVLPDKIVLYQGPHEADRPGYAALVRQVQTTVVHEIAHHFGLSDARLNELGWG